ncbi:MAG: heavy metal transporter [Gallionellales bacterium RBG_16_56_9]|nr:MAG: heavy metal transporter [Gallionellales bacterium RBG_16_56_9]
MFEFTVQDMTCGHCVATITKAVKQVEPQATVDADVQNHVVRIDGVTDGKAIEAAIREAGYTPQVLG